MLILTEAQVRKCLTLESCIKANRIALGALKTTKSCQEQQKAKQQQEQGKNSGNDSGTNRTIDKQYGSMPVALPSRAVVPTRIGLPRVLHDDDDDEDRRKREKNSFLSLPPSSAAATTTTGGTAKDMTLFKPACYYGTSESANANDGDSSNETLMGMKVISIRAKNLSRGKPTANATITMLDAETGDITAVIGGTYLTAARTAAGSAIATKACLEERGLMDTNKNKKHLVVFGAGIQAEMHIRMLNYILPGLIQTVTIFNRTKKRAEDLQKVLMNDPETSHLMIHAVDLADTNHVKEAVGKCDIIATATNCARPIFDWSWVNPNCHINGVGSYLPSSEEVDRHFVRDRCITIIDTIEALEVGDLKEVDASSDNFAGTLGDVLCGEIKFAQRTRAKCTFFKSVGTSIQDICTSDAVIKNAQELGIGVQIEM